MIEAELWQLYQTGDKEKIERLFSALADECDADRLRRAIDRAWGEGEIVE